MHRVALVGILAVALFALALIPGVAKKVSQSGTARKATWRYRRWRARRRRRNDEQPSLVEPVRQPSRHHRRVRRRLRRTRRRLTHPSRTVRHWWYRRLDRRS